MKSFIETICIRHGQIQHLSWHQQRVDATLLYFYPAHDHTWILSECIQIPPDIHSELVRCKITYDAHHIEIRYTPYALRDVSSVMLKEIPVDFHYPFKFAERTIIKKLFNERGKADEILMLRQGWITDTSIANIAFENKGRWYTPSLPLLAGTTWKRLISQGILIPRPIHVSEIVDYSGYKLFNAMIDFQHSKVLPVNSISF